MFRDEKIFNYQNPAKKCTNTFYTSINNLFNLKQFIWKICITHFFNIYCKLHSKNPETFEVPYYLTFLYYTVNVYPVWTNKK